MSIGLGGRIGNEAATAGRLVDSTPYPWPWDGQFAGSRCALLVLDSLDEPVPTDDPAWSVVEQYAKAVAQADGLVITVSAARPPRLTSKLPAPPAGPVASSRFETDFELTAPGWDAFFETELDRCLRIAQRDLLLLAGGWLEVGVHSTMRSANDRGYECLLLPDACIAIDAVTRAATISSTEMSGGIFGAVAGPSGAFPLLTNLKERSL